jgi:hypothetical protein
MVDFRMRVPDGEGDLPPGLRFILTSLVSARRAASEADVTTLIDTTGAANPVTSENLVRTIAAEVLSLCGLPPIAELPAAYEEAVRFAENGTDLFGAYAAAKKFYKIAKWRPPAYLNGLPWRALEELTGANLAPTGTTSAALKLMLHGRPFVMAVVLAVVNEAAGDLAAAARYAEKASRHLDAYAAVIIAYGQVSDIGFVRSMLISAMQKPSDRTRTRLINVLQIKAVYGSRAIDAAERTAFPLINKALSYFPRAEEEAAAAYAWRLRALAEQQELFEPLLAEITAASTV